MEANEEPKTIMSFNIPVGWKEELEKKAKDEGKSVSELVREFIDRGLHGKDPQAAQATQCYDDVARQTIRVIVDILQLYYALKDRADLMNR